MKIALFVLFSLFFVSSVLSMPCLTATCVPDGGNCTITDTNVPTCEKGSYCTNSTCTKQIALGGACNDPFGVGLMCVGSDQMKSMCYQGTCQTITRNLVAGGNCSTPIAQCNAAYYCDFQTSTCTLYPTLGANCSAEGCAAGLTCNIGTCIKQFSLAAGAECVYATDGSFSESCVAGLYCKRNGTLHTGICTAGFASSNAACNNTVPCNNTEEVCSCNKCTAPVTLTSSESSDLVKLDECIAKTNCDTTNPQSCCKEYQCTAHHIALMFYFYSIINTASRNCGYTEYNFCSTMIGRLTTAEKIGIAAGAIAVVVIIAGLVIFCVRRRSQYDRIN